MMNRLRFFAIGLIGLIHISAIAQQPTQWQASTHRNAVVPATGLPAKLDDSNKLWTFPFSNAKVFNIPTVHNGRIYVGVKGHKAPDLHRRNGAILCLDLQTGKKLWHADTGRAGGYGLTDVPLIDGEHIYIRTTSNDVFCFDMDGKEVWKSSAKLPYFNSMHQPAGTGLIIGDQFWLPTGHGPGSDCHNWESKSVSAPFHPHVIVFDKKTGKVIAHDTFDMGPIQHGQWSSLSTGVVNGKQLVFFGDAYGYLHALEVPEIDPATIEKPVALKQVWYCDVNPHSYRYDEKGRLIPYKGPGGVGPSTSGPCEIIAAPVFHNGKIYVTLTRDVHYSQHRKDKDDPFAKYRYWGDGALVCIDPNGEGDITKTNKVWECTEVNRSFCPPSIVDGLAFFADHSGYVNCVDIKDGKLLWKFDVEATVWNYFQIAADKKLYITNERDDLFIINATREGGLISRRKLDAKNNPSVGITDGIVIVATGKSITAYKGPGYKKPE